MQNVGASIIRMGRILWPLILPLMILLPGLFQFPYASPEAAYSDLTLAHYPYTVYLRSALILYRQLPLWQPNILSGHPFVANPLAGVWYPPGLLALFLPLPFGFNVLVILHLLWGGSGMYALLRQENLARPAALFGALGFTALPKIYAHFGAGHLTLLYALAWTPWLLWAANRAGQKYWLEPAILALIFLADPRWAVYAGILWWSYILIGRRKARKFLPNLGQLFGKTGLSALFAAPLVLPLLEFVRLSSRVQMQAEDILAFSLPPERLLGLFYPDFSGFHEWMLYAGGYVLTLSLLAIIWARYLSGTGLWITVWVVSLVYALGANIPGLEKFSFLPLFDLLRVPSRALFIVGMAMIVLAAHASHRLMNGFTTESARSARVALFALLIFVLGLAGMAFFITGSITRNFAWGALVVMLVVGWLFLRLSERIGAQTWWLGVLLLSLLDWSAVNLSLFSSRPPEVVLGEGVALSKRLAVEPGDFRVYSPGYSVPQQTAFSTNIQLSDGVDPLQLLSYVEYMQSATGVPSSGYSVTLPPFATGNPEEDNRLYRPDSAYLGLLNVRFVAAPYKLAIEGLIFEDEIEGTYLYRNQYARPRAWVQTPEAKLGDSFRRVESLSWSPNKIELSAAGPGLLVLSELAYPGWQVKVDNQLATLVTPAGLFRGVELSPGLHKVEFVFRPLSVYLGLLVCSLAVGSLVIERWIRRRHAY